MTSTEQSRHQSSGDWRWIGLICSAHVVTLRDTGLIGDDGLAVLLRGIESTRDGAPASGDSSLGLIADFDERVDAITPAGYSGAGNIGRGEIDLAATVARCRLRTEIANLAGIVQTTLEALVGLASEHIVSLMPAHVDGQIAQPTTFGNLLGGVIGPMNRASSRLEAAYQTANRSPFGSGSLASSGMSIDRDRLAELLGFDGLVVNTLDAVSASDHFVETADAVEAVIAPVRRWCEELLLWMRAEPGSFAIAGDTTSLIGQLPQAHFPAALMALIADGRMVAIAASGVRSMANALPFGPLTSQLDGLSAATSELIALASELLSCFSAFIARGLSVNRALLANRAGKGFSTTSDLPEFLMLEEQIDPGSARNIAALTISTARDQGLEAAGITQELIDGAALMVIGQEIKVEFEAISRYLAPRRFIERRTAAGAPSPASTRAYLELERERIAASAEWWNQTRSKLDRAEQERLRLEAESLQGANS